MLVVTLIAAALAGYMPLTTDACRCFIGQELDPATNQLRWALSHEDPCQCMTVEMSGVNMIQPRRPFHVSYFDAPLELSEIKKRLNCTSKHVCWQDQEEPLGMENGQIPDDHITASSAWDMLNHGPPRARLNTQGYAASWTSGGPRDLHPWIQVDFQTEVYITGLSTQARGADSYNNGNQRVTHYNVGYSRDGQSWCHVTDTDGVQKEFIGNIDAEYDKQVVTRFGTVLHARFLRILPTAWIGYCSMRFEVIGCYPVSS